MHLPAGERDGHLRRGRALPARRARRWWCWPARSTAAARSRDWAAKGTLLLGVRAVIAESYERIHRSNLVGMGVLPLQFKPGENAETLGLTGRETLDDRGPRRRARRRARSVTVERGARRTARARRSRSIARLDTPVEINYYRNGGILQTVLRKMRPGRTEGALMARLTFLGAARTVTGSQYLRRGRRRAAARRLRHVPGRQGRCASATGTRRPFDPGVGARPGADPHPHRPHRPRAAAGEAGLPRRASTARRPRASWPRCC